MRQVVVASVFFVPLFACSGGDGGPSFSDSTRGVSPTSAAPATVDTDAQSQTLEEFLGWGGEEPAVDTRDREVRLQEAIRVCMVEQGFAYIPVIPPEAAFAVRDETGDEEERIRVEGFGFTTWFGREDPPSILDQWEDPNQEGVNAMAESERQAWSDALYGTEEEQRADTVETIDPDTGETMVTSGFGAGCFGAAYAAEFGGDPTIDLWDQLAPEFDAMYERIEADPRIVETHRQWGACMAEAGYDGLTTRHDIREKVSQEFNERLEAITGTGVSDPFAEWTEAEITAFFKEKTPEEVDAFMAQAQDNDEVTVDYEALAALQQDEIHMAIADWECAADLNEVYDAVSAEYETGFVTDNQAVLELIREAQDD